MVTMEITVLGQCSLAFFYLYSTHFSLHGSATKRFRFQLTAEIITRPGKTPQYHAGGGTGPWIIGCIQEFQNYHFRTGSKYPDISYALQEVEVVTTQTGVAAICLQWRITKTLAVEDQKKCFGLIFFFQIKPVFHTLLMRM